jgi:kynurenine formamidase
MTADDAGGPSSRATGVERGELRPATVTAAQFRTLFRELSNRGRWGPEDERGALNHLTPERVAAATHLVRDGTSVTLSLLLNTERAVDCPKPADHYMTDGDAGSGALHFNKDYVGLDYHNDGHTHIDALCHVAFEGAMYNGRRADKVTTEGSTVNTIEVLKAGLVGRGVLLDIPRHRGVPWLEPGEHVFPDDLEDAERGQGVRVQPGDILLIRTGHVRRLAELGPWKTAEAKAGLHPTAMKFVAARDVAALGSDGNSDTAPSTTQGVAFPIHVLAIVAMGVHLLDYLQFEDLRHACDEAGRWEFLFAAAPLRITGGTGSPLNPVAVF